MAGAQFIFYGSSCSVYVLLLCVCVICLLVLLYPIFSFLYILCGLSVIYLCHKMTFIEIQSAIIKYWLFPLYMLSFCSNTELLYGAIVVIFVCYCMVFGFTTTFAISAYHHFSSNPFHGEVHSIQHYVIKFVNDLL